MNYELAKELKDAGFPQDGVGQFVDVNLASPTLSELIEACGVGFEGMNKLPDGFHAYSTIPNGQKYMMDHGLQDEYIRSRGNSSFEEAVARLWLALKRK